MWLITDLSEGNNFLLRFLEEKIVKGLVAFFDEIGVYDILCLRLRLKRCL